MIPRAILGVFLWLAFSSSSANAQDLEPFDFGFKLGWEIMEILDPLEDPDEVEDENAFREAQSALAKQNEQLDRMEELARYGQLQQRANANRRQIRRYINECYAASDFCQDELRSLTVSSRSLSAETRAIPINPISVELAAFAQESEFLLVDLTGDETWRAYSEKEFELYWDGVLDDDDPLSLAYRLPAEIDKQSAAISEFFGAPYPFPGIATEDEFLSFARWVEEIGAPNLRIPGSLGCALFKPSFFAGLMGGYSERAGFADGEEILRFESSLSGIVHLEGSQPKNQDLAQYSDAPVFEFLSRIESATIVYSPDDPAIGMQASGGNWGCAAFEGDPGAFEDAIFGDLKARLEPLEVEINEPVARIRILRDAIGIAETAQSRLGDYE